ncbi:hypothetical protein BTN50_1896 [Candidatus Enterovibrio altilux]|uniref:Uncharacterized protein n=1 Tax=Candidatus Enterovibrio altilux TaxID=1927128 RepID=A0A291BBE4_9GAMM|nr:hypothetical protein BTN50_1896 [Candidatus Enterovibrio luxaltus]
MFKFMDKFHYKKPTGSNIINSGSLIFEVDAKATQLWN